MAKKNFSAGSTKSGVLNNDGGEKLREIQAKTQYNFKYIPKDKIIPNPKNEKKVFLLMASVITFQFYMMQKQINIVLYLVNEDTMLYAR